MEELQSLVTRTQTGDLDAYGLIVGRFQDMAYGYAFSMLGDFHLAQDAAQNAFIKAYQEIGSVREAVAFPGWFRRIVYTECAMMTRRKHVPSVSLDSAVDVVSPESGPAEMAERGELARRVQGAIRELPDAQRVVTTLFYINGYSHQDIADFLEVPAKTVKSRLHASRSRLRERMIDMVEDELKTNKLPVEFTKETVEQAVAQAKELNKDKKFNEAEELLRQVLPQSPENPDVLKELNRALMQGRVYGQSRFEMLREVADYGKTILHNCDDEYAHQQLAKTLLAVPAMSEAIEFLQCWIESKGPNLERLGMLAWARGCTGDNETSESTWQDVLNLAQGAEPDEVRRHVPFIAKTLVDCFAQSGDLPRAQRIAQQAWERCHDLAPVLSTSQIDLIGDAEWIGVFYQAKLDWQKAARDVLARLQDMTDPRARATAISIRNCIDDPQVALADWLDWVRERVAAGEQAMVEEFRSNILHGFWIRRDGLGYVGLAQATWEAMGKDDKVSWSWERFNPMLAIIQKDWEAAEEIVRRDIEANAMQSGYYGWTDILAVARGVPTPPEVLQAIERKPVEEYTFSLWYVIAREAAAAGDKAKAFDALRKALAYWTNSGNLYMDHWENDPRWGELRDDPEFKAAFDDKRKRIGPVYGTLFYFPGW
jgi:RNA polymerase sigma factor (sigma-70 family)